MFFWTQVYLGYLRALIRDACPAPREKQASRPVPHRPAIKLDVRKYAFVKDYTNIMSVYYQIQINFSANDMRWQLKCMSELTILLRVGGDEVHWRDSLQRQILIKDKEREKEILKESG